MSTPETQKLADAIEQRHGNDHNGNRTYLLTRADRDLIVAALRAPEATVSAYGEYTPITVRASSAPNVDKGPLYDSRNPNYSRIGGLRAPEAGEAKQVAGRFDNLMGMLRRWRDADHADNITLGRSQIIDLIEGVPAAPVSADAGPGMSNTKSFLERIRDFPHDGSASAKGMAAIARDALLSQRPAAEAEIRHALQLGRDAVMESFGHVKDRDDQLLADARLQCIDAALTAAPQS